jgi:hypothetical protein
VDIAARLIGLEHRDAVCGSCFCLQSPRSAELIAEVRDSPHPGGMAHACELETSLYLALERRAGGVRPPGRSYGPPGQDGLAESVRTPTSYPAAFDVAGNPAAVAISSMT